MKALLTWLGNAWHAPSIHDITTDVVDPPCFEAAAELPANRGRDLRYPNGAGDSAARQQAAYPDVATLVLTRPPAAAYAEARRAALRLGWTPHSEDNERGRFEAEARTRWFRFVDDVVVRVRAVPGGAAVDVRSLSRLGVSDMGANAARIRRLVAELAAGEG